MKRRSAGVVPVRQDEDGPRFLILRCYQNRVALSRSGGKPVPVAKDF